MTGRALKTALAASVVLNLFAVGGLLGAAAALLGGGHGGRAAQVRPILKVAADLPSTDRARFHQVMRSVVNEALPLQRAGRENRILAAGLFERPDFDAAAISEALKRAREADFAFRVKLEDAVIAFAASLPASERSAFARGLARNGPLRRAKTAPASEEAPPIALHTRVSP
jgi:uncharacterized membrane protein